MLCPCQADEASIIFVALPEEIGKESKGLCFENRLKGRFQTHHLSQPGDHSDGEQRMTAKLKEVVMTAHTFETQNLAPDCSNGRFRIPAI